MINSRLIVFVGMIVFVACKSQNQSKTPPYPIITLEKTTCMGECPSYIFEVYPNGEVFYTGSKFVSRIGKYTGQINEEGLGTLKEGFENAKFFEFGNVYSANLTDLPTTYIYYDNGLQNSKVTDYFGAPEALKSLELFIEEFIETIDWKKN